MPQQPKPATYGAASYTGVAGQLPVPFPRTMGPRCVDYLREVVESGLTSDIVARFESAFADALGVARCIATPGCTPALAALAAAMPYEPGDEVIVSPITDYGTIQGLVRENLIPVFADTAPGSVNVSAETIEPCITDRTRAILVVHKTGLICDMDPINALATRHGLDVFEDACQAVFSEYKGRLAGTLARAGTFSFDAEKTMGSDVGGCLVTDDDDLAERVRFMGQSRGAVQEAGYGRRHTEPGYAYRMTQCTAAICLAQLEMIGDQVAHIDSIARRLTMLIEGIPGVRTLAIPDYMTRYSCWMFAIALDPECFDCTTDQLADELASAGIPGAGTGRYYLLPESCTFLRAYSEAGRYPYSQPPASRAYLYSADTCPNARDLLDRMIRWSTICAKYEPEHCDLAASIIADVTARHYVGPRGGGTC